MYRAIPARDTVQTQGIAVSNLTREEFLSAVARIAGSVYDFHQRFGVPAADLARPEEALAALRSRLAFLMEEVGEHARELNRGNLPEAATELADVAFVALGSVLVLDALGCDACLAVSRKNDGKTSETHAVDRTSGKLVRRQVAQ